MKIGFITFDPFIVFIVFRLLRKGAIRQLGTYVCLSDTSPINSFHQLIRLRGSRGYVTFLCISLVRTAHAALIEEARSIDHRAGRLEDWLTSERFAEVRC